LKNVDVFANNCEKFNFNTKRNTFFNEKCFLEEGKNDLNSINTKNNLKSENAGLFGQIPKHS